MNIIKSIVKRKTFISMLFIALSMLGYISYTQLPVELIPNAELPYLIVSVRSQVATDPTYMESQAIIPLEGAIGTLEGIDNMESFAEQGSGTITVNYKQGVDLKYAYLKLQEKVDVVKAALPEGLTVTVTRVDIEQVTNRFMDLQVREIISREDTLRTGGGLDRIRTIIDEQIVRELEGIDGIASVQIFGGRTKSVEIILDEEGCEAYGITPSQIRNLIRQNADMRTFVGRVYDKNKAYFVNVTAEYADVRSLENIVVRREGNILLKNVADIFFGTQEETSISRVNGGEAITMQLVRDAQTNLIRLSHDTQQVIARLNEELRPQAIEIVIQTNMAEDMERNIDMIITLALIGGGFAIVVLWLFLRNLRLVLTIALAIPISVMTAFNFFYAFDISINSLTLVGMALAIGMLLDNSIVVLENIYRLAAKRKDADTAVAQGTKEVWRSISAATATTIVVFLPFIFSLDMTVRLLGRHISVSIISTLIISLIVALLLVPTVTHFFLRNKQDVTLPTFRIVSQKNRLLQIYTLLLKSCMRYPIRTILGALILGVVSFLICTALSISVSREIDTKELTLYLTMRSGSTLETTDFAVAELEKLIEDIEEKEDIISQIYEEEASVTIILRDDYEDVKGRSIAQVKNDVEQRIDEFRLAEYVGFEQPQASRRYRGGGGAGGGGGNPAAGLQRMMRIGAQTEKVVIRGQDFERMRNVAEDIRDYFGELESIANSQLTISGNRPEMHLIFDTQLLSLLGIPLSAISGELGTFTTQVSSGLTFKADTEEYDITIKTTQSEEPEAKTFDDLRQLQIPSQSGATYDLEQISRIIYSSGKSSINRVNQEKHIEVTYQFIDEVNVSKTLLEASRLEVDELISQIEIPAGIAVEVIHEESEFNEFYLLIGAAVILIYMILASVFESLSIPFVIMFSIIFAATGSFWALIFTGNSLLSANTLIGFLILFGIVVNNGIILIDYTRILRAQGYRRSRALLTAGQARIRPILITAITTIVAMFPLAMGRAEYVTRIGAPFAITVIGGLALSTLITLVLIPTVYTGLETMLAWLRGLNWKIKIVQVIAIGTLGYILYENVGSIFWRILLLFAMFFAVLALTYLILASLRRAQTTLISPQEKITISIQNLVKIYDQEMRFVREWKKGKKIRERAGLLKKYLSKHDFEEFVWQVPLLGFLIFFVYFYLKNSFWFLVLSIFIYFALLMVWTPVSLYLHNHAKRKREAYKRIARACTALLFWGFPLFTLTVFYLRWDNIALVIFLVMLWYLVLAIYTTSNHLHRRKININRLKGRFAGLKRRFYVFVQFIPIIGRKKNPFRALNRVSLTIGSGMFGLLGPNGAGKTTLMRVICGILEQSYGKVRINGIDANEKREELQGLIGYLPQEFGTYENMTAYEFLNYQAMMKNIVDKDERERMIHYVLSSVHMDTHMHEKIGSYSGGMKQRIGIAQILLHLPRILVVDEPTAGLDPRERIRFRNLLVELARDRVVVFSTHIIEDISSSCNKVAVLDKGELKYLGEPTKMTKIAEGKVWQFYVPITQFETLRKEMLVVHHMRDGEQIRVRCISERKPTDTALSVRPSLEDAYLCLLKRRE